MDATENYITRFQLDINDLDKYTHRAMTSTELNVLKTLIHTYDQLLKIAVQQSLKGPVKASLEFDNINDVRMHYKFISSMIKVDVERGHVGGYIEGGDPSSYDINVFNLLLSIFNPDMVVDIGCAEGINLNFFKEQGKKVIGIDGSPIAISNTILSKDEVIFHDYIKGSCDRFLGADLCICSEFVEHVSEKYLENYMIDIAKCKVIALTYAPPGMPGHHHVNCREESYWENIFEKYGFKKNNKYTTIIRQQGTHQSYWKKYCLIFEKNENSNK